MSCESGIDLQTESAITSAEFTLEKSGEIPLVAAASSAIAPSNIHEEETVSSADIPDIPQVDSR